MVPVSPNDFLFCPDDVVDDVAVAGCCVVAAALTTLSSSRKGGHWSRSDTCQRPNMASHWLLPHTPHTEHAASGFRPSPQPTHTPESGQGGIHSTYDASLRVAREGLVARRGKEARAGQGGRR